MNRRGVELCIGATEECRKACLYTAGRGAFSNVQDARMRRANLFVEDKVEFLRLLREDITKAADSAMKQGKELVVRLDGTSDAVAKECYDLMREFPLVQFMDYTKDLFKFAQFMTGKLPKNYTVALSFTPENQPYAIHGLEHGARVSVVFQGELPETWHGFPVVDGDKHDLIFLQPMGSVLGLKAKGKARAMASGGFIQIGKGGN